jgi:nucleoside-diphosphate-sugar epimerase/SAM-dependent methyltransferase
MLEDAAGLINVDSEVITRTAAPAPTKSSKELLADLLRRFPDQSTADKLTFYTGSHLAEVLRGETDGIKLIFGTSEGRELVSGLYAEWPINRLMYKQMEDFLGRLASKLDVNDGPIKILEMGAGTGGTTRWLLPLLASLQLPVEYTFTDLAPSFVAAARKKFGKQYPFMKFRTHDIEKAPADDLIGTQHIIVASNAVHATHSLSESAKNIRKALRPDGFLMMIEMTGTLYWVDIIFGLFEGWWYFDDGRTHAVTHESRWEKDLQAVGYGHVDWTDGDRPENKLERLIVAFASGDRYERLETPRLVKGPSADLVARQAVVDRYVRDMTSGFDDIVDNSSFSVSGGQTSNPSGRCVVVTGATGSLGCHLVAKFASLPDVAQVVCLNRRSRQDPESRQTQSLRKKGIVLPAEAASKLCVFETDMSKPQLGLSSDEYASLVRKVTHIVHNAWLMNAKWPIRNFEPQLRIMRNLLDFAKHISTIRSPDTKVTFQFISSIATVGHWPIWTGRPAVPEERMTIDSVLPTGYGDAKYICELMIDETLHRHPDQFRAMAVRLGQVAGSSTSGYWNPTEHLPFVIKSSQTLKALPDFDGLLSWTPVDGVASTLVDLVSLPETDTPYPIYHIDNPIRQAWKEMIPVLADTLSIPLSGVIPFDDWVQRVKDHPRQVEGPEGENPAILLIDFLDANFLRMSCGGLLLETKKAREHSHTLANLGPVSNEVTKLFVESWKEMGFLV